MSKLNCFFDYDGRYFIIEMWLKISASTIMPAVNITIVSITLISFTGYFTVGDASPCFPSNILYCLLFNS